jgi:glycosyltransferase involved in cell wall biosynthesis
MKVINVVQDFQTGGIQKLLLEYLRYFKNNNEIDYHVVVLEKNKHSLYDEICAKENLKIHYLDGHASTSKHYYIRKFVSWKSYDYSLYKFLKKEKPDIVHTHNTRILKNILWTIKKLHKKYKWFHTLHSDPSAVNTNHVPIAVKVFGNYNVNPICLNETQFLKAKERYGIQKCFYLNNCFDMNNLKKNLIDANDFKKSLSINNKAFIIGAVGRIAPVKNYSFLINIVANLKERIPDVLCIVVGDDSSSEDLKQQIKSLSLQNNIMFVGNRPDVGNFYNIFDRFINTSFTEASPFVCLEAQAFRKYSILSNAVPIETVCTSNKVVRLSINDNIEKWVDEIIKPKTFAVPKSELNDFAIEKTSAKMLEIYNA